MMWYKSSIQEIQDTRYDSTLSEESMPQRVRAALVEQGEPPKY